MNCGLPRSSVHGIAQARILEWVAISFSRGPSQPKDQTHIFCIDRQIHYHWVTWDAHDEEVPFISLQSLALLHLVYTQEYPERVPRRGKTSGFAFLSSREPYREDWGTMWMSVIMSGVCVTVRWIQRRLRPDVDERDNIWGVRNYAVKLGSTHVTFLFPKICGIFSLSLYLLALEYHTYRHIFKYNDDFVLI